MDIRCTTCDRVLTETGWAEFYAGAFGELADVLVHHRVQWDCGCSKPPPPQWRAPGTVTLIAHGAEWRTDKVESGACGDLVRHRHEGWCWGDNCTGWQRRPTKRPLGQEVR